MKKIEVRFEDELSVGIAHDLLAARGDAAARTERAWGVWLDGILVDGRSAV